MNILLVGSGGREHAILKKLRENPNIDQIWALSGNPGYGNLATCVPISPEDLDAIVQFAKEHPIDFAIISPDDPLVMGLVDRLEALQIPCFGPNQKAAEIEGSKAFSKNLMKKYHIPTADYEIFDDQEQALQYVEESKLPIVIKASGLAKGKGVTIAKTRKEAREAILACMAEEKFGASGHTIVIEEFLEGPEVTILSFVDGKTLVPMLSSMDHKAAFDGDHGPNTGGMGCIAPNPFYTKEIEEECMEKIFLPTIKAMEKENRPFKGCLYFGLILTEEGPKVIEYNCRFGDPEAEVLLPLLESDLFTIMQKLNQGKLDEIDISFSSESACCLVMASKGYPASYKTGFEIHYDQEVEDKICFAGVREEKNRLVTNGGRILTLTEKGKNLEEAINKAYQSLEKIHFDHAYYRKDIGQKALQGRKK